MIDAGMLIRPLEGAMSGTSIHHGATEPSFFYVLMAESCFRRAVSTRHPKAGGTLRQIGRDYLAKAKGTDAARTPTTAFALNSRAA
jgi:hypothetical protein